MPKLKGHRPPPGTNAGLMERVAKLQDEMMRTQEELAQERLTVTVGGGAVTVVADGRQRVHQIEISAEALAAAQTDRALLQDMLVTAINSAMEQSQTRAAERLQGLGGLGLPGL
jgi:hypothetical protein